MDISVKKYEGKFGSYINNFKTNNENRNVRNLYRSVKISEML